MDRGHVEDLLCSALDSAAGGEVADCIGGGTLMGDPPESDFQIELTEPLDPDITATVCRDTLGAISFTQQTTLSVSVGDRPAFDLVVGGDTHPA